MTADPSHPVRFRLAGPADAEALLALGLRTVTDTFAHLNDPVHFQRFLDEHYRLDLVQADLANPAVTMFICEIDGVPAAYAKLSSGNVPDCIGDPAAMQINRFYVDKPFLGRGVAVDMMQLCLDLAHQRRHRTVFLGVWEHNARAIRFYTRWGFARCGECVFMVGDDRQIDWWMKRGIE